MHTNTSKRFVGEVVELSRDCELGQEGDRAVVSALAGRYMTLTFPDRGPDDRDVHTGADYKYLCTTGGSYEGIPLDRDDTRNAALRELRPIIASYLEGSDDATRVSALLDMLEASTGVRATPVTRPSPAPTPAPTPAQESRERAMFGCLEASLDKTLGGKEPRDVAMYAMSCLSNAQELIQRKEYEGQVEWTVAHAHHANTIRQLINIAKYAIDKAVPR